MSFNIKSPVQLSKSGKHNRQIEKRRPRLTTLLGPWVGVSKVNGTSVSMSTHSDRFCLAIDKENLGKFFLAHLIGISAILTI